MGMGLAGLHHVITGISHIDWKALRRRGFNAVVIDKDNCLVSPVHSLGKNGQHL